VRDQTKRCVAAYRETLSLLMNTTFNSNNNKTVCCLEDYK